MPIPWHEFFQELRQRVVRSNKSVALKSPLILGGWASSTYAKRERLISHLQVAEAVGEYEWAIMYLDRLGIKRGAQHDQR